MASRFSSPSLHSREEEPARGKLPITAFVLPTFQKDPVSSITLVASTISCMVVPWRITPVTASNAASAVSHSRRYSGVGSAATVNVRKRHACVRPGAHFRGHRHRAPRTPVRWGADRGGE